MRPAIVLLLVLGACCSDDPEQPLLRPAPSVPSPTEAQKIDYFYGLWTSGAQLTLGSAQVALWNEVGGDGLRTLGRPALDFLLSEDRYKQYRTSPDILSNLLHALPRMPTAAKHPRLVPFLLYWLDPENAPPTTPAGNWAEDWRRDIFLVFQAYPDARAVPACLAELKRTRRVHDVRAPAIGVLLATGHATILNQIYAELPPTEDVPEPDLRIQIVLHVSNLAAPAAGLVSRRQAEGLEPVLRKALLSGREVERFNAMGTLLRLGDKAMERELIGLFEARKANEPVAWSVLDLLAKDGPHPFVKQACEARVKSGEPGIGFGASIELLTRWWIGEHAATAWKAIADGKVAAMMVMSRLLAADRPGVVAYLKKEAGSDEASRMSTALRFIGGKRVREVGPTLLERVRELSPEARPPLYKTLVTLDTAGTEALLLADLESEESAVVKNAAVTELFNLRRPAGLAKLAAMLTEGDEQVLFTLLRLARQGAVPDAMVPSVLDALKNMAGEQQRRTALMVLRYRGRLDDVRDGLVDAYRKEPSRRVAAEIALVIRELAHR